MPSSTRSSSTRLSACRHNVSMASLVDRLTSDSRFVVPVTRTQAAAYARQLVTWVEQQPDFEWFPEGELGVVVYALLAELAQICPDRGDFGQLVQGVEAIPRSAAKVVGGDTFG